jgi:hypothetical protein
MYSNTYVNTYHSRLSPKGYQIHLRYFFETTTSYQKEINL